MSNRLEMAPMAEAEAEEKLIDDRPNDNFEGVDEGLMPRPRKPSTENGLNPRISPRAHDTPEEFPRSIPAKPGRRPLDVNLYATKKTVAQGMMDLALLTANANQLRYVLESGATGPFYYFSVVLISLSIILQLVVGVILIFVGRYNVTRDEHAKKADTLNNWVVLCVFLITVINVFFSAFGIDVSQEDHYYNKEL